MYGDQGEQPGWLRKAVDSLQWLTRRRIPSRTDTDAKWPSVGVEPPAAEFDLLGDRAVLGRVRALTAGLT